MEKIKRANCDDPFCIIKVYRGENGFHYQLFRSFESQEDMDEYWLPLWNEDEDEVGSTFVNDDHALVALSAPWTRVIGFYDPMIVLLEGSDGNESIIDVFRTRGKAAEHLYEHTFGIFSCDIEDFEPILSGGKIFSGEEGCITVPKAEGADDDIAYWTEEATSEPS